MHHPSRGLTTRQTQSRKLYLYRLTEAKAFCGTNFRYTYPEVWMSEIENEVQTILDALLLLRRKGVLVFAPGVETDATGERATVVIELEEKRLRIHGEGTGARNYVIPLNPHQFAALSSILPVHKHETKAARAGHKS
jgi:hypothetical protein